MARMEKSPLLANGYNAPPTHLGPMGFMHQHALMSPGMPHPGVPRPDGSIIKGQPMHNMEALARKLQTPSVFPTSAGRPTVDSLRCLVDGGICNPIPAVSTRPRINSG
ncbi:hypothetical protein EVAR_67557_1 [Eumeta japonica]|uniref:Uncharacterized protein n=1 Tax=Eumeta variegata TaxID=151549 RepID=A0A4C1ZFT6_EUMVA|nr:hypothetical protein EVAR_67557_1 [Eumeta japonica]